MKRRYSPLRRVIAYHPHPDYPEIPEMMREVYECGHMARPKLDIHGEYHAYRRRCSGCAAGRPADLDPLRLEGLRKS